MNIALMLGMGLAAGVLSGLFGIGGGIILVPMLMFFLKCPQLKANGMSMVALLPPIGILGAMEYYQSRKIDGGDVKSALVISAAMILGIWLGAKLAIGLPAPLLKKGFAIFLVAVAAKMWFSGGGH